MVYKSTYGFSVIYPVACMLPKLSVCFLYLQLFEIQIWTARVTKVVIAFLIINAIAWLVPSVVVCRPISQYWSYQSQSESCIDVNTFGTWISLPQIVSDLVILALPLPIIAKIQLTNAKKLGLVMTFLAASL